MSSTILLAQVTLRRTSYSDVDEQCPCVILMIPRRMEDWF
jgi:hypothetical protein